MEYTINNQEFAELKSLYGGSKLYLYVQGIDWEGWLIVPIYSGQNSYAVACFDPKETQHCDGQTYSTLDVALRAGKALVETQIGGS